MIVHPAEESFQKGQELLSAGQAREALAYFSGAVEIERRISDEVTQARYLSYYGLCVSLTGGSRHEALRSCRMAAKLEGFRPEICWNLGRVLLGAGKRREAYQALQWGLRMDPKHKGITQELTRMGVRRPPVLPFLSRVSKLNVMLGRFRS
jgi:tetratricopeptide (TPR) repeat protein